MTDKEIIIDGVDVSGCEFYNKDDKTCREANGKYNIDICDFDKCESSNCYYKQLKRKEQECEKLKQTLAEIKKIAEKEVKHAPDGETFTRPEIKQILQKISECEVE